MQGRIPATWCDRMDGMTITERFGGGRPPLTTLSGELSDQAALSGVLNTLYELHLPVLSVSACPPDDASRKGQFKAGKRSFRVGRPGFSVTA